MKFRSIKSIFSKHLNNYFLRAVGYINIDTCISGDILSPSATPSLKSVFMNTLEGIPSNKSGVSYASFLKDYYSKAEEGEKRLRDRIGNVGAGSDQAAFAFYAGIPSTDHVFVLNKLKYPNMDSSSYPAYHTGFETFYMVDKLMDPDFKLSKVCTAAALQNVIQLAESPVLPYSLENIVRRDQVNKKNK